MRHGLLPTGALLFIALLTVGCASIGEHFALPGRDHQGKPEAMLPPSSKYELLSLSLGDGTRIAAEFGEALDSEGATLADAREQPSLIWFYGNGGYLGVCQQLFERLRRLGVNVLIPEYPGYGMSAGRASERGCYAAADAAYAWLTNHAGAESARIVVAGHSLGGAVAVDLASRRPVAGLITLSTFSSARDLGYTVIPRLFRWTVPSMVSRCRFDNLAKIPRITCPILIVHGTADRLVPPQMAARLAEAATSKVNLLRLEGADHFERFNVKNERLWEAVGAWIRKLPQAPSESL